MGSIEEILLCDAFRIVRLVRFERQFSEVSWLCATLRLERLERQDRPLRLEILLKDRVSLDKDGSWASTSSVK